MKWFQHDTNAEDTKKHARLIMRYGYEGYGIYWHIVEKISSVLETKLSCSLDDDMETLAWSLRKDVSWVQEFIDYCVNTCKLFTLEDGKVTCWAILERLDNTSLKNVEMLKMRDAYRAQHPSHSVATTEVLENYSVGAPEQITLEEIKEKKEKDKKEKPEASLSWCDKIPQDHLDYFTGKYELSEGLVKRKAQSVKTYCESRGKVYKNYKATLENWIQRDKVPYRKSTPLPQPMQEEMPMVTPEQIAATKSKFNLPIRKRVDAASILGSVIVALSLLIPHPSEAKTFILRSTITMPSYVAPSAAPTPTPTLPQGLSVSAQQAMHRQPSPKPTAVAPVAPSPKVVKKQVANVKLSDAQIANARLIKAAFPDNAAVMVAIAMAESGLRCDVSIIDSNGKPSVGLFQINDGVHKTQAQIDELKECSKNIERAKGKIKGRGLKPWGAFTSGAYRKFLSIAQYI